MLCEWGSLIFTAASGAMLPRDSNENRASSRSNGTVAAASIPMSPEMRSLSSANRKALVAWLSFRKVTKGMQMNYPYFLGWHPPGSPHSFSFSETLSDVATLQTQRELGICPWASAHFVKFWLLGFPSKYLLYTLFCRHLTLSTLRSQNLCEGLSFPNC